METIEAIRPLIDLDDRAGFDCGKTSLNNWLQRNAMRNQSSGASRTYVLPDLSSANQIKGFVSLAAGEIQRQLLPKKGQRNMPDPIPIILLGQLAVDLRWQSQGISKILLAAAFTYSVRVSKSIGCFALVTHPLDENIRAFYQRWGFSILETDPQKSMYIPIRDLEATGVR